MIHSLINRVPMRGIAVVVLSALLSMTVLAAVVYGATTIGTNIDTGGTLTVSGAVAASSTMQVTGAVTTYGAGTFGDAAGDVQLMTGQLQASSTALFGGALTTYANGTFGNASTDVNLFTGTLQASTTALFTSGLTTYGNSTFGDASGDVNLFTGTLQASTTALFTSGLTAYGDITLQNAETISNSTDGTVTIGATNLVLVGTASTSALKVGDEPAAPTINGMVFGYCSFGNTAITASTTGYVNCTVESGLTGALVSGDRVFVQATSSFDSMFVIQAASTTGVSTINLRVLNTGLDGTADGTLNATSINFWALR